MLGQIFVMLCDRCNEIKYLSLHPEKQTTNYLYEKDNYRMALGGIGYGTFCEGSTNIALSESCLKSTGTSRRSV